MSARRSLPQLFLVPALVFGLSSVASKCSDTPLSLGHDKGGTGGSDSDGGGGAGNAGAVGGSGGSDPCPRSACGPQLGLLNYLCSDGTTGGPTGRCLPRANGTCGWEIHDCQPAAADAGGVTGTGSSDGGKVTRVDAATTTPCSEIEDSIRSLIATHQSCTTNADCHPVALYCLPGARCTGTHYVNQTIDQSAFTTPQHELNQCLTGDPNQVGCARCFIADPAPACVNGTCGPAPLCTPPPCGSQCPPGTHSPTDANGCVVSCTCVPD